MQEELTDETEPMRLTRRRGVWRVECTELVAIDESLLRPERRQVASGADVARYLGRHCAAEVAREALRLTEQADDGTERVFVLQGDAWVPLAKPVPSQRPLAQADLAALSTEMSYQFGLMRALYEAILARVVALEAAAQHIRESLPPPRFIGRVPTRREVARSLARSEVHGPVHAPVSGRVSATVVSAAPPTALAPPSAQDVIECVRMLGVTEVAAGDPKRPDSVDHCYAGPLVSEHGEEVGAILIDQRGAVELGGGMLGLPVATRDEQAEAGLAANTLDALNEIANNLVGIVNRNNPKCYVRLRPLELARPGALDWLASTHAFTRVGTRSGGNLWVAARSA